MNHKWVIGIGVVTIVVTVIWMRELVSWRPVTVAKVNFAPTQLHFSRNGKKLLIRDDTGKNSKILGLQTGILDSNRKRSSKFFEENGLKTYPRVSPVTVQLEKQTIFGSPLVSDVSFTAAAIENTFRLVREGHEGFHTAVSKPRGEIYCELFGTIWIWNLKDKRFKRRIKFAKNEVTRSVFSSDAKWLFTVEDTWDKRGSVPMDYLRLYDVQSGKLVLPQHGTNEIRNFGFSPDGQFIWYAASVGSSPNLVTTRIANSELVVSTDSSGPVKWLLDGRIGIVDKNGFNFRDEKGHLIQHLPGPFDTNNSLKQVVTEWAISPDGNYIYSAEQSGDIRRWRAR